MVERIVITSILILIFTCLLFIALYHLYMFGLEGGFQKSISFRLLIAGICFNSIFIAIIVYLVIQVKLLLRLVEKFNKGEQERPRDLKEKVIQSLRGRSTSKKRESIKQKKNDFDEKYD